MPSWAHAIPNTVQSGLYNVLCGPSSSFCYAGLKLDFTVVTAFPCLFLQWKKTEVFKTALFLWIADYNILSIE